MSKITLVSPISGTAEFSITTPSGTSTDRTLTLPDSTGTIATAESTLAQFNASGSAPVYACRAWVNFNGTGTVAIRASGNVSSITDNGTGNYTVNFTTAMPDTNYSLGGSSRGNSGISNGGGLVLKNASTKTTSAIQIFSVGFGGSSIITDDNAEVNVEIFR